jgi:hypothetical protein
METVSELDTNEFVGLSQDIADQPHPVHKFVNFMRALES